MTRDRLSWLIALLVAAAAVWWISANTEWVDEKTYRGPQGEAAKNPVYVLEQLLKRLDMKIEHREVFDPLPPEGQRLILLSSDWELIPGRGEALHQWVLRGGHLILPADVEAQALSAWVPVTTVEVRQLRAPAAASASKPTDDDEDDEAEGILMASTPPLWGDVKQLDVCLFGLDDQRLRIKPGQSANWSLTRELGAEALRVPVGRGSVTVLNAGRKSFSDPSLLQCDNALVLAATVQAEPGAFALIYLNETREALLPWLWHRAWIVILTGLLALAAALWRASVRFGPRMAVPTRLRRSIAEQVRGLGHYLQREGREALLIAQQRALDEAAAKQLQGYRKLPNSQRAHAIAAATSMDGVALSIALHDKTCPRAALPARLQLLESARRLLLNRNPDEKRRSP